MAAAAAEKERHEAETTKQRPEEAVKDLPIPVIRPAVKAMRSKHDRAFAQT